MSGLVKKILIHLVLGITPSYLLKFYSSFLAFLTDAADCWPTERWHRLGLAQYAVKAVTTNSTDLKPVS